MIFVWEKRCITVGQYRVKEEALTMLMDEDRAALMSVYRHRCLNEKQMAKYHYPDHDGDYVLSRIRMLIDTGFLEVHEYGEDRKCVFFLTNMGVQFARDSGEGEKYTYSERRKRRTYEATSGTLRMPDKMLDHQTQLNTLSLEIEKRCHLDPQCYKDSMFASNFTYAQPDGVFELPEFDIFLEMDMGHERVAALKAKWGHYRTYFNSRDYYLRRNKKIVVLFATENVKGVSSRRASVVKSLNETIFELFGPMFDCCIGTNEELVNIAERLITGQPRGWFQRVGSYLQNKQGFRFSRPKAIADACGEPYLYMRKSESSGEPLMINGGRPLEFLFEDGSDRQMLGLKRAAFYKQTQSLLAGKLERSIPLLVLVPDEQAIYRDLSVVGALAVPDVYYVTADRLRKKQNFYEAVFQFDLLGKQYGFTDWALQHKKYEKKQI